MSIMNNCEQHRCRLKNWDAFSNLAGLIQIGSDGLPCDGEGMYQENVAHIQNCKSCKAWLDSLVPNEDSSRLNRLNKYCCSIMFGAVEEAQEDELKVGLIGFQGESTWAVQNFEVFGGNLLISYCPWCGHKLPKEPFIQEDS